jgi:hypothetical protein
MKFLKTKKSVFWVFGLFPERAQAEDFVSKALKNGFTQKDFAIYLPHGKGDKYLNKVKVSRRFPELRWLAWGILSGAFLGAMVGLYSLRGYALLGGFTNIIAFLGFIFAGSLFGGMYSILYVDSDTILHAYYAEKVRDNRILIGLGIKDEDPHRIEVARQLFLENNIRMHVLPEVETGNHLINQVLPRH